MHYVTSDEGDAAALLGTGHQLPVQDPLVYYRPMRTGGGPWLPLAAIIKGDMRRRR